jgi:curved DNA-binding protein CbpA
MFTLPDDPYAALGVSRNAQIPEIRSAHRKLVLKCHPDKVTDPALKVAKQEEFQKVQKAYELLSDERERQKYDDMRQANDLEKENAERRRQRDRDREFTPGRTPPRYDSEFARNPQYKTEPAYKIRTAEPPPGYTKSVPFPPPYSSKSPYVNIRTPPRSFEDNIQHSFDDVPTRRSKKTSVVYEERISLRHDEERRSRKKDDDAWERPHEKITRRKDLERKEQYRKDLERKERKKEEKRKAEKERGKSRDQERRKEIDEKRNPRHKTAYVEEEDDYVAQTVSPSKPEKKSKSGGRVKEMAPKELPGERERKQYSHLEFAEQYLARSKGSPALSRAQTYHYNVRHVSPPPATPTPPPAAAGAGAFFDEEETVRRSSARRRVSHDAPRSKDKSSAHKKSSFSREPEYVDEPVRHIPPLKKAATMPSSHQSTPPSVPESPPRVTRAQTEHYSRPAPSAMPPMARAATWRGDGGDVRDRSRSRHARSYSDNESEEDTRPRRSRRARSPDDAPPPGSKVRYTVLNGRTVQMGRADPYLDDSPVSRKSKHGGYYEANMSRPMEHRPAMPSYGSYGSQVFEKVKTSKSYNPDDVVYADVAHAPYREVYGY